MEGASVVQSVWWRYVSLKLLGVHSAAPMKDMLLSRRPL